MENPTNNKRTIINSQQLIDHISEYDNKKDSTLELSDEDQKWTSIDWSKVNRNVSLNRKRIFAKTSKLLGSKNEDERLVHLESLIQAQERMIFSYDNLLFSIRRITQINQGKVTSGLDKFLISDPKDRMLVARIIRDSVNILKWEPIPVRRIYIPKKNGKLRPLGIPSIVDRIIQCLILNALEPYWEAQSDIGSYGFKPGKSCHDAMEKVFLTLTTKDFSLPKKQWVLEGDIKGCFDHISHKYLLDKVRDFPASKLIKRWLAAGYIDKDGYNDTNEGTPQGCIISPLLCNIALDGIESELGIKYRKRKTNKYPFYRITLDDYSSVKTNNPLRAYCRYADDFIVLCESKEDCLQAKSQLVEVLKVRGLELSDEKTKITHITEGFDFLGLNVRSFKGNYNISGQRGTRNIGFKLIIQPSKKSKVKYREKIDEVFKNARGKQAGYLISTMNPIVRGWSNYFKPFCSRKTFESLDFYLYQKQLRYGLRVHNNKSKAWVVSQYFGSVPSKPLDKWVFIDPNNKDLFMLKHRWTSIKRHVIVLNGASPDDPYLTQYWINRKNQGANSSLNSVGDLRIAKRQKHTCVICLSSLYNGEPLHKHHIVPKNKKGLDTYDNLVWLHNICHQSLKGKEEAKIDLIRSRLIEMKSKKEKTG